MKKFSFIAFLMLSTADPTLYAMDTPNEEVLPSNAAPESHKVLSLSESRENLNTLKKFTSALKMICGLPQNTLGFDPQNPTPENIAELKKKLTPFTKLSIPDTLFSWMIEEEFRTRISHPTDPFSDHLMGTTGHFTRALQAENYENDFFESFKECVNSLLSDRIDNKKLRVLQTRIQERRRNQEKDRSSITRLYSINYYFGTSFYIHDDTYKSKEYEARHSKYSQQQELRSFLRSLFILPKDFERELNYDNAFEALRMLCFEKMKANVAKTKTPRPIIEKSTPSQKKKKEAQQNSEQGSKNLLNTESTQGNDRNSEVSSNEATSSRGSTSTTGVYPTSAPFPSPEENQKPSPELYEEKTSDDEILEEKTYEDYIRELIEYQLSQKNPMKGSQPQAVREENIRPLYDLSNTSASILTSLLDPQKYAAVMKRINMLAPLAQLFEELNIGYRLTEGKIISPRNGEEAFVFHAIHGRPMGKTVQNVVGGLIEHLDKMIPAWRNFLLSEN